MLHRLHQWFVPVRLNDHNPYLLRPLGLMIVALMLIFMPAIYNYSTKGSLQVLGYATAISVSGLHDISNAQRINYGVAPLSLNGQLNQAAYAKAQHMFANNYWAHTAPDGTSPWSFISGSGFAYSVAGENLAKNFSTSAGVVDGWMNSPSHRDNILKSAYDSVGYAVVNGTLQGQELTLIVALYAKAYVAPAPAPPPSPAPTPAPAPQATASPPVAAQQPAASPPVSEPSDSVPVETVDDIDTAQEVPAQTPANEIASSSRDTTTERVPTSAVVGTVSMADVAGAAVTAPIKAYTGLNWGQKTSIFILSIMMLLYILNHTLVWRAKKRGVKHVWLRSHPLVQASFIALALTITLASGAGSVL